jgi:hypothetical protein
VSVSHVSPDSRSSNGGRHGNDGSRIARSSAAPFELDTENDGQCSPANPDTCSRFERLHGFIEVISVCKPYGLAVTQANSNGFDLAPYPLDRCAFARVCVVYGHSGPQNIHADTTGGAARCTGSTPPANRRAAYSIAPAASSSIRFAGRFALATCDPEANCHAERNGSDTGA